MKRPALAAALLAPLVALCLTTDSTVLDGRRLIGAGTADLWGHAWGYWRVAQALAAGELPWLDAPILYPTQQNWWIVDLPTALVVAPLVPLGGWAAWTGALLLHLSAGAAGCAAWLRERGVSPPLSLGAALLVALSPFARGALWSGLPDALALLLAPGFALLLERSLRVGGAWIPASAVAGAFLAMDGLYAFVGGALVGVAVLGSELIDGPRGLLMKRAAPTILLAGLGVLAQLGAMATAGHSALEQSNLLPPTQPDWAWAPMGGADLASFVLPGPALPEPREGLRHRHITYLGPTLVFGAAWAALRERRARGLALLGALAALLAMGPRLQFMGTLTDLPLPGALLAPASNLYRLAGLALAALVGAVVLGAPRSGLWLALVALEHAALGPLPLRVPTTRNPSGKVETWLATQPEGGVLDLPLDRDGLAYRGEWPQRTFFLQTVHGRPIASGLYARSRLLDEVPPLDRLDRFLRAAGDPTGGKRGTRIQPLNPEAAGRARSTLAQLSFVAVTLDLEQVPSQHEDTVEAWAEATFGAVAVKDGARMAWALPPPEALLPTPDSPAP